MSEELAVCPYQSEKKCEQLKIQVQQLEIQLHQEKQKQKQLEKNLQKYERYREIVETQTELICRFLPNGKITFVNVAFSRYFNQTFDELIGRTIYSFIPETEHPRIKIYLQGLSPQSPVGTYEHSMILSSGEIRWQQWTDQAFFNEQGEVIEYQSVGRDITERVTREEALKLSEKLYRTIARHFPKGAVVLFDQNLRYLLAEGAGLLEAGLIPQMLEGKTLWEVFPPETCQVSEPSYYAALAGQEVITEVPYNNRVYITHTVPVKNEEGEILGGMIVTQDITERKQVEEELRLAKERFELAITASNDGFWDWNLVTGEIYFSPRWKQMIGYQDEELPNLFSSWEKVIFEEDKIAALKLVEDYNQGRVDRFLITQRFYHKNGSTVYILSRAIHCKDTQGRVIRMIGTHTDITELVNAQEELTQKTEILQMIIDHIPIMLAFYNSQGEIKFVNRELEKILGWSFQEIQQINLLQACYPDPDYCQEVLNFMLQATGEWKDLKTLTRQEKILDTAWANIRLSNGMQIGIGQDITKRKKAEIAIRQQIKRERLTQKITTKIRQSLKLDAILQTTVDEIRDLLDCDRVLCLRLYGDKTSKVVTESLAPGWSSLLGETFPEHDFPQEYYQRYCQGLPRIIPDINQDIVFPCLLEYLQSIGIKSKLIIPLLQNQNLWGLLIVHQCRYQRNWQQSDVKIILSLANQVSIAIQQSQLYHQLENVNQELHRLATVDGLTQVANRRYFDSYLLAEWKRLAREKKPLSLILCDVDFFKKYNDTYGHLQGDECLKQVADILKKLAKRPADLVARYGGEEFAVILPNTNPSGAMNVAQLIQNELAQAQIIHRSSPLAYVTLSQGITTCIPIPNTDSDQLIKTADQALYQAKAQGRNQAIFCQTELTTN